MHHKPIILRALAYVLSAFFGVSASFTQAMATETIANQIAEQIGQEFGASPITDAQLNALTAIAHGQEMTNTPPISSPVSLTLNQMKAVFETSPQGAIFKTLLAHAPADAEVVLIPANPENIDTLADLGLPPQLTDLIASASNVNGQSRFDLANARLLAPTNDVVESSVGHIPSGDGEGGDGEGGDDEGGDDEGGDGEGGDGEGGDDEGGDDEGGDDEDDSDNGGGGSNNGGWGPSISEFDDLGSGFIFVGGIFFLIGFVFGSGVWMATGATLFAIGSIFLIIWDASGSPGRSPGGSPYDPGDLGY